jgi:hypothetical protein
VGTDKVVDELTKAGVDAAIGMQDPDTRTDDVVGRTSRCTEGDAAIVPYGKLATASSAKCITCQEWPGTCPTLARF